MKRRKNPDQIDRQPLINQAKALQNMLENVVSYPTEIVRFTHNAKKEMIFCFLVILFTSLIMGATMAICDPDKWHKLYPNPMLFVILVLGTGASISILIALHLIQRVEIDTENKTIRFANIGTYHLWRIFSLSDAISIRAVEGGKGRPGIDIHLAPSSSRSWECVCLDNPDSVPERDRIDSELFLALVQQILSVHPDMKVSGMPKNYHGILPKEICEFDRRW